MTTFKFTFAFIMAVIMVFGMVCEMQNKKENYQKDKSIFWRYFFVFIICCVDLYIN